MARSKRSKADDNYEAAASGHTEKEPEVSKTRRRRLRGALQSLPKMPMDIIFEVIRHLQPLDLLHLARTSKAFRQLLMDRSSEAFWKASRKNVPGLPGPFPGMSEPAFARLCFEAYCHICFKPHIHDVVWAFRMRLCNHCKKTRTVPASKASSLINQSFKGLDITYTSAYIPSSSGSRWNPIRVLNDDIESTMKCLEGLSDPEQRDSFLKEMSQQYEVISNHAALCRDWYSAKKTSRFMELEQIKEERYRDIKEKLKELGYKEDVAYSEKTPTSYNLEDLRLTRIPIVQRTRPLTERSWQLMRPSLIKFLTTKVAPGRIKEEYQRYLNPTISKLRNIRKMFAISYKGIFPSFADFVRFPEVRAIVEGHKDGETGETAIDTFDDLLPLLPDLHSRWIATLEEHWEAFIRKQIPGISDDVRAVDLAISQALFCSHCNENVLGPGTKCATHDCAPYLRSRDKDNTTEDPYGAAFQWYGYPPWSLDRFFLLHGLATKLLEQIGCDPLRTTAQVMDSLNRKFACGKHHEGSVRLVFNWREAIFHAFHDRGHLELVLYGRSFEYSETGLQLLPRGMEHRITLLEDAITQRLKSELPSRSKWHCSRCILPEAHDKPWDNIAAHVKANHGIETPGDEDICIDPSIEVDLATHRPPVYLAADKDPKEPYLPSIETALENGEAAFEEDIQTN